jgi:hypothetical protein
LDYKKEFTQLYLGEYAQKPKRRIFMKHTLITLLVLMSLTATAIASDSIGVGARAGAVTGKSSIVTEAFADLYLNRLVSIGAAVAYMAVDRDNLNSVKRDESLPVTALFKIHAPIPFFSPYGGLGAALVFHDKRGAKGTPVALVGGDLGLPALPIYLNVEYRRQFDDELNILAGGIGFKF